MSNLLSLTINAEANKTGFSFNITTGEEAPSHGYMVSIEGHEHEVFSNLLTETRDYIIKNAESLVDGGTYLGCWFDQETESWYLDISLHFETLDEAMAYGILNHQRAVWDLSQNLSIDL